MQRLSKEPSRSLTSASPWGGGRGASRGPPQRSRLLGSFPGGAVPVPREHLLREPVRCACRGVSCGRSPAASRVAPSGSPRGRSRACRLGYHLERSPPRASSGRPSSGAHPAVLSSGRPPQRCPDGTLDLVALEAASAALPDSRGLGPGRTAAALGNQRGWRVWRDGRHLESEREGAPGACIRDKPTVLRSPGLWPVKMNGTGRANANARRATAPAGAGPRTHNRRLHRSCVSQYSSIHRAGRRRAAATSRGSLQTRFRSHRGN